MNHYSGCFLKFYSTSKIYQLNIKFILLRYKNLQENTNNLSVTSSDASSKKVSVLQTIFGYERFRGKQEKATDAIVSGSDCLIILHTFLVLEKYYAIQFQLL